MTSRTSAKLALLVGSLAFVASCGGGGGGGGGGPKLDTTASTLNPSVVFGTPADGTTSVALTATIVDTKGNPMPGLTVEFAVSGYGNALVQPGPTDANGIATGTVTSTAGESKTLSTTVFVGTKAHQLQPVTTTFVRLVAGNYYVRESGSDASDGSSPLAAWRTITHALTQVGPGDTVHVGAGTYPESVRITTAASATAPLVLRGDPEGCFTGDAGEVLVDAGGTSYGFRLAGASNVVLRGFTVRGAIVGAMGGGGIWISGGASDCTVAQCTLFDNQRGLQAASATRLLVEDNRISANFGAGVSVGATTDSVFIQNLVYANGGRGFQVAGISSNLQLEYSTFYRNQGDQIVETSMGSTGSLTGNVVSEGGATGIKFGVGSSLGESHNLSWAHAVADFDLGGALVNPTSLVADPSFVDPDGADDILGGLGRSDDNFRFRNGSAAFDKGDMNASERVLTVGGSYASMTSRGDNTLEGAGADGATINLGFHYHVQPDAYSSLGDRGARIAFTESGGAFARTRSWDPASDSFTPAIRAQATNSDTKWVVHRVSPLVRPEEVLAVLADNGTETQLFVREWDGRKWSENAPVTSRIQSANSGERGFDITYEQVSGQALLVYSDDDANPQFRTLVNGIWSADASVFSPALGTGTVLWVELVPKAGSNEVALVALDDQENLFAAVWDGNSWEDPILLGTQITQLREWQAFDAAWESLSGRLLVVWGFTSLAEQARFALLDGGTWSFGMHDNADAVGAMVELVPDPVSDQVMAVFLEGPYDDDVTIDIWDGTDWLHNLEVTPAGQLGLRDAEIGWLGDSGRGFALYRTQALSGSFNVAAFNAGWRIGSEVTLSGVGRFVRAVSRPVPGEDRSLILLLDETGALFAIDAIWSGNSLRFSVRNGGQAVGTGLDPLALTETFSLNFRRL